MRYQVTAIWDIETDLTLDDLKRNFVFNTGPIKTLGAPKVDFAEHPRERGDTTFPVPDSQIIDPRDPETYPSVCHAPEELERRGFIPSQGEVVHPWDQGLWIFPEGHPLHVYERQAHRDYHSEAGTPEQREPIKVAFLEAGQKSLPPGGEQDET